LHQFSVDDVEIHPSAMLVVRGGEYVELTSIEFTLLAELTQAAGRVADRETLSRKVLGRKYSPSDRSLDNHVSHICRKLGPAADGRRRIISVRGKGYIYRCFQPVKMAQTGQTAASAKLTVAVDNATEKAVRAVRTAGQMSR
jgi:DNA-binding response OmpR family regulator